MRSEARHPGCIFRPLSWFHTMRAETELESEGGRVNNQRGVALPTALLVMLILLVLLVALAMLAKSEPPIAANHVLAAQARALAESGLAHAAWALGSGALVDPLPSPIPAEYSGLTFLPVGPVGGFTLTIVAGPARNQRLVTSTGWVPRVATPRAVRKVQATLVRLPWLDPPCALCTGGESPGTSGEARVSSARIDARTGRYCAGLIPSAAVMSTGAVATSSSASVMGPASGEGVLEDLPSAALNSTTLTSDELGVLKSVAREQGTYYQGTRAWVDSPPPAGLVFVDTATGAPLTDATLGGEAAEVELSGDFSWSGWLVVAGSIRLTGNVRLNGLVYAQDDVVMGSGAVVVGAVVAANRQGDLATTVGSNEALPASITYDCPAARDGGGTVSQRWFIKPGTYREMSGS